VSLDKAGDGELLTEREAARELRMSVYWVRAQRRLGAGPPYYRLGRAIRYTRTDLAAWLTAQRHS